MSVLDREPEPEQEPPDPGPVGVVVGPESAPVGSPHRLLYADTLRGVLMLLGVAYHALSDYQVENGSIYNEGWIGWDLLREFTHLWRMPAFFLLAGFFATLVLARRGVGPWWRRRVLRLGVPLVFGMLVINSLAAMQRLASHDALGALSPSEVVEQVILPDLLSPGHLWFLITLLVFSSVLAAGAWAIRGAGHHTSLRGLAERIAGSGPLVLTTLLGLALLGVIVVKGLQWVDLRTLTGGALRSSTGIDAMAFGLGCLLGCSPRALDRLADRAGAWVALIAIGTATVAMTMAWEDQQGVPALMVMRVLCGLSWTVLLLALFRRFADVGGWLPRYIVDASLTVYVVHLWVMVVVRKPLLLTDLDPISGGLLTIVGVALGSFLLYEILNAHPWSRLVSTGHRRRGTSLLDLRPGFARRP